MWLAPPAPVRMRTIKAVVDEEESFIRGQAVLSELYNTPEVDMLLSPLFKMRKLRNRQIS